MCGIAGFHVFGDYTVPNAHLLAAELLLGIEHRGQDATGYGWIMDDGTSLIQKASMTAKKFVQECKPVPNDVRTCLLHTRLATNGSPAFPENNHPTVAGSMIGVHNGVVWNDDQMFTRTGAPRSGTVDSEVFPMLANHYGFNNISPWIEDVQGSFAIALADAAQPGELMLVRGDHSPLFVYKTNKLVIWASTYITIKNAWAKCFGTPPAFKSVEEVAEGNALFYDKVGEDPERAFRFEPYSTWVNYYTQGRSLGTCSINTDGGVEPGTENSATKALPSGAPLYTFDDDDSYAWGPRGWAARCGICDSWFDDGELEYSDHMWICEDCSRYVIGPGGHTNEEVASESVEVVSYDAIAEQILAAEEEVYDDETAEVLSSLDR